MNNEADPAYHAWAILDAELRRREVSGWILILPTDPGGVFQAASLLPAFRAAHGKAAARISVAADRSVAGILDLFSQHIDQTLMHPALTAGLLNDLTLFSRFRPGDPFVADPDRHGDGRLAAFLGCGGVTSLDLWRYVLHLPWQAEPVAPTISAERRAAAAAGFAATGLPVGRTCVLSGLGAATAAVAARLRADGREVCVARTPGAVADPAEGATVNVDWAELIPFCETAGAVVAQADGRCEILKYAACPRVFLHADPAGLRRRVASPPWASPAPADVLAGDDPAAAAAAALAAPA